MAIQISRVSGYINGGVCTTVIPMAGIGLYTEQQNFSPPDQRGKIRSDGGRIHCYVFHIEVCG